MSVLKKLFSCPRGYHEVSISHLALSGYQYATLSVTTELGNYVHWTYFRCAHCGDLFIVEGGHLDVKSKKAWPVVMSQVPDRHMVSLKQTPWWPTDRFLSQALLVDDDLQGLVTKDAGDPLPEPQKCPAAPTVPPPSTSTTQALRRVQTALEHLNIVVMGGPRRSLKDQIYCHMAETIAQLGTCCRLKVGCVLLTKEGKVCGIGYNGSGPGMPHCECGTCNEKCRCRRTRHAEKNALSNCSGKPYAAFLTHEPCVDCAKDIIAEGVRRVVYVSPYNSMPQEERDARQEWIDHYGVIWEQLPVPEQAAE